eukprot:1115262-Rhodomonas_salina.3
MRAEKAGSGDRAPSLGGISEEGARICPVLTLRMVVPGSCVASAVRAPYCPVLKCTMGYGTSDPEMDDGLRAG